MLDEFKESKKILDRAFKTAKKAKETDKMISLQEQLNEIEPQLNAHLSLDKELKVLKRDLKEFNKSKDRLIEELRVAITPKQARENVLNRWEKDLVESYFSRLETARSAAEKSILNVYQKYSITLKNIEEKRNVESKKLSQFLMELGYE